MRHFDFPDDVLQEIQRDRFKHPVLLVRERMEILWLKAHGISHGQIAELSCAARSTVQRTLDLYADGRTAGGAACPPTCACKSTGGPSDAVGCRIKGPSTADLGGSAETHCQVDEHPAQYNASAGISTRGIGLTLP